MLKRAFRAFSRGLNQSKIEYLYSPEGRRAHIFKIAAIESETMQKKHNTLRQSLKSASEFNEVIDFRLSID